MKKYIVIGKNSQETAASMLNKPQNRREMVEPLVKSFNAEFCEFLYLNSMSLSSIMFKVLLFFFKEFGLSSVV